MQLHQIKPKNKTKKSRRIARGGKRGGYSGRGIKGQKSRAGAKIRPAMRDAIMKFPKQRGRAKHSFKSLFTKPAIINLGDINKKFKEGETVSPKTLNLPKVKILAEGEISKKLFFQNVLLSKSANEKIKKTGGAINE